MKEDRTWIDPTWMEKTGGFAKDMTLRDHYAGLAMPIAYQIMIDSYKRSGEDLTWWSHDHAVLAGTAYEMADAMLKGRSEE
jgi:hypothetical protein